MSVVGNNVGSIGCKSAIDKLVVIVVGNNQPQMKLWVYELHKLTLHNRIDDILRYYSIGFSSNNLLILFQYFVGNTQSKATCLKIAPHTEVFALR